MNQKFNLYIKNSEMKYNSKHMDSTIIVDETNKFTWSSDYEDIEEIDDLSEASTKVLLSVEESEPVNKPEPIKTIPRMNDSHLNFLKKFSGISKKIDYSDDLDLTKSILKQDDWVILDSEDLM